MVRLECPDCHGQLFHIQVPPTFEAKNEKGEIVQKEIVAKGDRYLYILCAKCDKLWRLTTTETNEGFVARAKLEKALKGFKRTIS
jgi:hypothetical protein